MRAALVGCALLEVRSPVGLGRALHLARPGVRRTGEDEALVTGHDRGRVPFVRGLTLGGQHHLSGARRQRGTRIHSVLTTQIGA